MKNNIIRFRLSGLNSWSDCQRRVAAGSFVDEITGLKDTLKEDGNAIGSAVGTACHTGVESLLRAKLNGETKTIGVAVEEAIQDLKSNLDGKKVILDNETTNMNDAINQVAQIVKIYDTYVLKNRVPKIIEERFNYVIGCVEFSGQIDLQTIDLVLSDLKTGKHLGNYFAQLGGYSVVMNANGYPTAATSEAIHIPRLNKKKAPYVNAVEYNTNACENVAKPMMMQIETKYGQFIENNNPDIFIANPSSTICSEKYCRAFGTEFCSVSCMKPKIYSFME